MQSGVESTIDANTHDERLGEADLLQCEYKYGSRHLIYATYNEENRDGYRLIIVS